MTFQEFVKKYEKYNAISSSLNVETLIYEEIVNGNISFEFLMQAYFKFLENEREYNKCKLKEAATLLHLKRLGMSMTAFDKRELHTICQYSSLSCEQEKESENYDPIKSEKEFKQIYNLD